MRSWEEEIKAELLHIEKKTQKRQLHSIDFLNDSTIIVNGRKLLNLASNNYLGLASDERLIEASIRAAHEYGAGSTASRLIVGNYSLYEQVETELARWKKTESALIFNSGYTANVGIISTLVGRNDLVFSDKWNHASIIDGIVLSRAEMKRYQHNDLDHLEALLKKAPLHKRKLIVTDTVFSMDGDIAPLKGLVELKEKYGAILMVDEAHSSGVYGEGGEGLVHDLRLQEQVDVQMGTFSKALGSFGAYVTGKQWLIDYFVNKMRSFIFTTALPPAVLGSIQAAIHIVQQEEARRKRLHEYSQYFRTKLRDLGFNIGTSVTQIVPVIIGSNELTVQFSERLQERGIAAVAIRPPTVPEGTARIRFSLMATLTKDELDWAIDEIASIAQEMGLIS
ncbi:8-amino-7-oxononanoate synthase [Anoxybacillus vitaminiphilus]|uniref:8-amino-7-ketopelargonate synthase n=1 Tax=Paranoxybacillus vitaminiphilus TaxID=581036 RepID=A0A327Y1S9_9BACL|nr:8-amino-7-oxononanoate synthase [Anoxybacillus vitaminiphilus]RAK14272.1 8-amino-7-oxononanoate synthase [Anoxybacillus vitaminiphilus]